jgi:hypothetical protein
MKKNYHIESQEGKERYKNKFRQEERLKEKRWNTEKGIMRRDENFWPKGET